jgi:hypothetical protein
MSHDNRQRGKSAQAIQRWDTGRLAGWGRGRIHALEINFK